jgi:AcrR family transcriptional regulator
MPTATERQQGHPGTTPASRLTRQGQRQANRVRILHAARTGFSQRGYQGATIEEIAAEAGLCNGAVYYNFASKEDLFLALLDQWTTELLYDLGSAFSRRGSAQPGQSFQDEINHVIDTLKRKREWRLLLFEFVTYAARNPAVSRPLRSWAVNLQARTSQRPRQRPGRRGAHRIRWRR